MTVPVGALALGSLLRGSTSQQTTVTTTNTLTSAINPSNVINIGGGVTSNPFGAAGSQPSAFANASQEPGGGGLGFPGLSALGSLGASGIPGLSSSTDIAPVASPGLLSGNMPLLLGVGALAFLLFRPKKKG